MPEASLRFEHALNTDQRPLFLKMSLSSSVNHTQWNPPPPKSNRGFDRSTAADLAKLGRAIVNEQPELLKYTSLASAVIPGSKGVPVQIQNHNNFLWKKNVKLPGVDGLKTGYIDAGGSSIVLTAKRGNKRAIVVVTGSSSAPEREANAGRMLKDALDAISW